jgi:hypothetical protein
MGQIVNANDEKRCAFVGSYLKAYRGIRWRGFGQGTPTSTEVASLAYSLRRSCTFDDDTHRTGCIEYRGKRVTFEVGDDALLVAQTDEALDPRHIVRSRPMVALEQKRRAAERVINTERHRERFGR